MADNYINPKVKSLYDALKSDGGDVGTEQEFNSWMFKPGEEGYKNRMKVYAAFKEDGADIGKDYGEFSRWLGLHAVKPQSAKTTTSPRVAVAKPAKAKTVPNEQGVDASPLPQGFGTLDKRHGFQAVAAKADEIDKREDGGDSLDEAVAKIENPDPTKPMSGKALERAQSYMQHRKDAADYRAETGKDMPAIFAPSQGKKTPDIAVMEAERDENGNITGRTSVTSDEGARRADYNLEKEREEIAQRETLDEKKRHREELREALDKKRAAIDAEMDNLFKDDNVLGQMGRPTAKFGDFSPYYQADTEYVKLKAAIRKADSEIQMLEDAKSGNTNNFFHGMGNTATDGYSFRMGLGEINDATAILSAAQDADAINRKLDAGEELTESEKNSLAVLRRFSEHDTTAGKYGNQYGMWHKGGETATGSMDYMIDFILAGGIPGRVAKGVANGVVKAGAKTLAKDAVDNAAKAAVKAASRGILKATGIAAGSTAAGALISNTTGMPRTIGSLATELAPTTFHYANDKGEMRYGAEQKVDDADDIMHAIYNAETSSIGENASEMTGLFFPGSKAMVAGIGKLGFRNTANSLIHMGTRPWAKKYAKFLERAGWNGIPGEALEEYVGVGYDALFKHDGSAMEQLKDPEFHRDVLFGTAAISVMLGVPGLMAHGGGYGSILSLQAQAQSVGHNGGI